MPVYQCNKHIFALIFLKTHCMGWKTCKSPSQRTPNMSTSILTIILLTAVFWWNIYRFSQNNNFNVEIDDGMITVNPSEKSLQFRTTTNQDKAHKTSELFRSVALSASIHTTNQLRSESLFWHSPLSLFLFYTLLPTVSATTSNDYILELNNDYSAFILFVNTTDTSYPTKTSSSPSNTKQLMATIMIEYAMNVPYDDDLEDTNISISNIYGPDTPMFIEYTLSAPTSDLLITAISNINNTMGSSFEMADGEFTAQYTRNTLATGTTLEPSLFPSISPSTEPTTEPTTDPTVNPTADPSTYPTTIPTIPTISPTTIPTESVSVTFVGDGVPNVSLSGNASTSIMSDPYGRLQASIEVEIYDKLDLLGNIAIEHCAQCFIWEYQMGNNSNWISFTAIPNDDISVYNVKVNESNTRTEYRSTLPMQSSRRLEAGDCVDTEYAAENRPILPNNSYAVRLRFEALVNGANSSDLTVISETFAFQTNVLPSAVGVECMVQDIASVLPMKPYYLNCSGLSDDNNLEYNALIENVIISEEFVSNPTDLSSVAPIGTLSMIMLLREKPFVNAITCLSINATFNTMEMASAMSNISEYQIAEEVMSDMDSMIDNGTMSGQLDYAVSMQSCASSLYHGNLTTKDKATGIISSLIYDVLNTSNISSTALTGNISVTDRDIVTELAAITSTASTPDLMILNGTTSVLVNEYIPDLFTTIDVLLDEDEVDADGLYTIAAQSQSVFANLELSLNTSSNESDIETISTINEMAALLVEYATESASSAISKGVVGESFNYQSSTKNVYCTKLETTNDSVMSGPQCGTSEPTVVLPVEILDTDSDTLDCAVMTSTVSHFRSSNETNRTQQSDTITVNIYGDDNGDTRRRRQRRRRLLKKLEVTTDRCDPYLLSIPLTVYSEYNINISEMSLGSKYDFPSCDFWNTNDSSWDTDGCFVYDITDDSVLCACTHLTTFAVSADTIIPESNLQTALNWRTLTVSNLLEFPIVWITILTLFIMFVIVCIINPRHPRVSTKRMFSIVLRG